MNNFGESSHIGNFGESSELDYMIYSIFTAINLLLLHYKKLHLKHSENEFYDK